MSSQPQEQTGRQIHPTAEVHPKAELGENVVIGPHTIVTANVKIGDGTVVHGQAFLDGHTRIGRDCQIFPFASVGAPPQDLKYRGEPTELIVGDRTLIRECATLNTGTVAGGGVTKVGNDTLVMAYVHLAHDVIVGDHCVLSNNAALAGHVILEDWVVIAGGWVAIHQFVRIGAHSFLGAGVLVGKDVPPFVKLVGSGRDAYMFGLNSIGLERRGFSADTIKTLKAAYRAAFRQDRGKDDAAEYLRKEWPEAKEVQQLADFLAASERGISPDSKKYSKRRRLDRD